MKTNRQNPTRLFYKQVIHPFCHPALLCGPYTPPPAPSSAPSQLCQTRLILEAKANQGKTQLYYDDNKKKKPPKVKQNAQRKQRQSSPCWYAFSRMREAFGPPPAQKPPFSFLARTDPLSLRSRLSPLNTSQDLTAAAKGRDGGTGRRGSKACRSKRRLRTAAYGVRRTAVPSSLSTQMLPLSPNATPTLPQPSAPLSLCACVRCGLPPCAKETTNTSTHTTSSYTYIPRSIYKN